MRKYKVHTTHGVFEFSGTIRKDTLGWIYFDTTKEYALKFQKEHIILIEEGNAVIYGPAMITFETRINGTMISHIYAHNLGKARNGKHRYRYEYYQTGDGPKLITGRIEHDRADGAMSLLSDYH